MSGKSKIIILLTLLCTYLCQAQHITTRLLDSQGVEIIRATVFLQDQNNKTLAYTSSNNEGLIEFKNVVNHPTASQLTIQKVGIEKTTIALDATKNNYGLDTPLYLLSSAEVLNEITIKATSPITVKKDTVVYNVKQFSKGDERVIEDLLKNLPGLEISTDGKISVNNQEVEKVMVDGTDLFDRVTAVLIEANWLLLSLYRWFLRLSEILSILIGLDRAVGVAISPLLLFRNELRSPVAS